MAAVTTEQRLGTLENRIVRIEERLEHLATKDDLRQLEVRMIKWMVGTQIAWAALVVAGIRFLGA